MIRAIRAVATQQPFLLEPQKLDKPDRLVPIGTDYGLQSVQLVFMHQLRQRLR